MNLKLSMMLSIILTLSFLGLSYGAEPWTFDHINKWDIEDQALFGASSVLSVADCMQTRQIFKREAEGYWEINPIINWGVDTFGENFVPAYFVLTGAAKYAITGSLKGKARTVFLGVATTVQVAVVKHNYSIGLKFRW